MDQPDAQRRRAPLLIVAGALMLLAGSGPALAADEEEVAPGFDTSRLVKFEGQDYQVESEDWVATRQIKKIEAGRVSTVTITTTATGTYSSDAMFSPHVQYPGISVQRLPQDGALFFWSHGGWSGFHAATAGSFFYYDAGDTSIIGSGGQVCVTGRNYAVC